MLSVGTSSEFRKAKSNWKSLEDRAAEAIIASATAESITRQAAEDEPTMDLMVKMESGVHAGLQTAAQVQQQLQTAEEEWQSTENDTAMGRGTETIYRDASGRVINIVMKRAEARKQVEEEARKEAIKIEAQKGDVQRAQLAQRREDLADAKYLPVSRFADDKELNEELKDTERWNDPAAQFLTSKKAGKSITGKPLYKGAIPPNRYKIRPGYRWDGVDRGNGFEGDYFKAQNHRKNLKDLDYAWQMDE